jgi:hypothetical protein
MHPHALPPVKLDYVCRRLFLLAFYVSRAAGRKLSDRAREGVVGHLHQTEWCDLQQPLLCRRQKHNQHGMVLTEV